MDFDMSALQNIDGKVRVSTLIQRAIGLCSCQLDYQYSDSDMPYLVAIDDYKEIGGNTLLGQYIDTRNLADTNWYDALYDVLYSFGLVLRYIGSNRLQLMSLRSMPRLGNAYWADVEQRNVVFVSYATRELLPAVKSIQEIDEFDVDIETQIESVPLYNEDTSLLSCQSIIFKGPSATLASPFNTVVYGYKDPNKPQFISSIVSNLLNVSAYPKVEGEDSEAYGQWDDKNIIYYAVNAVNANPIRFYKSIYTTEGKLSIKFVVDKPVSLLSDFSAVLNTPIASATEYGTDPILLYRLIYTGNGKTLYYDASVSAWKTSAKENAFALQSGLFSSDIPEPISCELAEIPSPGIGLITFEITNIQIRTLVLTLRNDCVGMYMRIKNVAIDVSIPEDINLMERLTVTTKYTDKYAVKINKYPSFAVLPTSLPEISYIPNAIVTPCTNQYKSPEQWAWSETKKTGISLSRLIHQQLLAFYAKPNNILTGELAIDDPVFNALYKWNNQQHLLTSGSLNIISGRMENVTLREFYRYDHMWEVWPEQDLVEVAAEASDINIIIHSNQLIRRFDISIPSWITFKSLSIPNNGIATLSLSISENNSGEMRSAYIRIVTAYVKINQY
jgi:hypothetical protein